MKIIDKTTYKFILVGIANTLIGTSVMFIAYNVFRINYWLSTALNYIVGSIVSYILNKYFTFQNKEKSFFMILKFTVNILICYLVSYGFAKPIVIWGFDFLNQRERENLAMLIGMFFFVILNYFGQRFIVFKKKN